MMTSSVISCIRSLSELMITTGTPASFALRTIVAIRSSASTPTCSNTGIRFARTMSRTRGIWSASSSGGALRLALYCSYISVRKLSRDASNATAR